MLLVSDCQCHAAVATAANMPAGQSHLIDLLQGACARYLGDTKLDQEPVKLGNTPECM